MQTNLFINVWGVYFLFLVFSLEGGGIYITIGIFIITFQHCLLCKSDNNLKISHSFSFITFVKYLIIDRQPFVVDKQNLMIL